MFAGYAAFFSRLEHLKLTDAYALKPILDGKQISNILSCKTGPWLKSALEMVIVWQLRNPDETDPKGAIAEILERKQELGVQ